MKKPNLLLVLCDENDKILSEMKSHSRDDAHHRLDMLMDLGEKYFINGDDTYTTPDEKYSNLSFSDDIFNQKVEA